MLVTPNAATTLQDTNQRNALQGTRQLSQCGPAAGEPAPQHCGLPQWGTKSLAADMHYSVSTATAAVANSSTPTDTPRSHQPSQHQLGNGVFNGTQMRPNFPGYASFTCTPGTSLPECTSAIAPNASNVQSRPGSMSGQVNRNVSCGYISSAASQASAESITQKFLADQLPVLPTTLPTSPSKQLLLPGELLRSDYDWMDPEIRVHLNRRVVDIMTEIKSARTCDEEVLELADNIRDVGSVVLSQLRTTVIYKHWLVPLYNLRKYLLLWKQRGRTDLVNPLSVKLLGARAQCTAKETQYIRDRFDERVLRWSGLPVCLDW